LMTVKPNWMSQIETVVDSMWTKLKDYYTTASDPFAYTESIILHPSLKLKWFKIHEWLEEDKGKYSTRFRERFEQIYSSQAVLALQLPPSKRQYEATLDSSNEEPEFGEVENYLGSKRYNISRIRLVGGQTHGRSTLNWLKWPAIFMPFLQPAVVWNANSV